MSAAMSRSDNGVGLSYTGGYGSMQPPGALPFSGSFHRNGSMHGHQYPSMASRHSHPSIGSGYSYGSVNDDDFGQYSQAPQYMLPGQDPQTSLSSYSAHETSRGWTPMSNGKPPPNILGLEHDPAFKYGPSHFSHMNSSTIAPVGTDDALFPPMNSMARHLPQHGSRILPSPRKTSLDPSSNSYQKADTGMLISGGPYQHIREKPVKYNPGDPLPTERPPPMIPTQKEATTATASRQG
ncbi:MAG: hypothetical protein Q9179_006356 [Wetmoreana sp. 5 TL-2023]